MDLHIITPPVADETRALDHGLIALTEAIAQVRPQAIGSGAFGGRFGYGAEFENDVFEMHMDGDLDCICEDDPDRNQDHEAACPFSRPNFRHKASGFSVWWYKWIGRGMETKNADGADLQAIFSECLASLKEG